MVGLESLQHRSAALLSGGQQQRVALARALVANPRLLLFDEPLSNLDQQLREQVRVELRRLVKKVGTTALYVTHDQQEAMVLSDRVAIMRDGLLEQVGDPETVYQRPASRFVAEFLGAANFIEGTVEASRDAWLAVRAGARWGSILVLGWTGTTLRPGHSAIATIRPEHLRPVGNEDGDNVLTGEVVGRIFLGDRYDGRIRVHGEAILRAHWPPGLAPRPGERIRLSFPPDRCVILPA